MKVIADRSRCMGLGNCELAAPGVFEVGDDGAVLIVAEDPQGDLLESVATAVDGCPTRALSLIGD